MSCRGSVVWDEGVLGYNFGNHPLNPIRLEFTVALARELGVLDDVEVVGILDAHRQPDEVARHLQHGTGHARVRHPARVFDERLDAAERLTQREQ